jgi:hypothetical protein
MGQGGGPRRGVIAVTGPGGAAWSPRRARTALGHGNSARRRGPGGNPGMSRARQRPAADGRRGLARPSRGPARPSGCCIIGARRARTRSRRELMVHAECDQTACFIIASELCILRPLRRYRWIAPRDHARVGPKSFGFYDNRSAR